MNIIEIKLEGRMDFAKGFGLHQNPYYRRDRMPGATGEEIAVWHKKIDAWEAGWGEAASEQQVLIKQSLNKPVESHRNGAEVRP